MVEKFTRTNQNIYDVHRNERCMTLCDFAGVPAGTKGTIVENAENMLTVEWDNLGTQMGNQYKPLRDGFAANEIKYLAFKEKQHGNSTQN